MSANLRSDGTVRQLDRKVEHEERLTEEQVQDPPRLVRLIMALRRDVTTLLRRWSPRRLDFEAQAVDATGTTLYRFVHRFGGAVRYWPVDWDGAAAPNLRKDAATTDDVLVLTSTSAGTATIRVEEAG